MVQLVHDLVLEEDIKNGIEKFKKKYQTYKQKPGELRSALIGQPLNISDINSEHFIFLATEFPEIFHYIKISGSTIPKLSHQEIENIYKIAIQKAIYPLFLILLKYCIDFSLKIAQLPKVKTLPWFINMLPAASYINTAKNNLKAGDLILGVKLEHRDSVERLLGFKDASLLTCKDESNRTALEIAAAQGYKDGVDLISKSSVYPSHLKQGIFQRAILIAYRKQDYALAALIARNAGMLNEPIDGNMSLIDCLARDGKLHQSSIKLSEIDENNKESALHQAVSFSRNPVIEFLLGHTNVTRRPSLPRPRNVSYLRDNCFVNNKNYLPLHQAVCTGNAYEINILCKVGADVLLGDSMGRSALEVALDLQNQSIFNVLMNHVKKDGVPVRLHTYCTPCPDNLLDLISNYLLAYPLERNLETLDFFWNYFGNAFHHNANADDKIKIAYFFKGLYFGLGEPSKNDKDADGIPLDSTALLIKKIVQMSKLYQQKTKLTMNTVKHGFFIGRSTMHVKLEKLMIATARIVGCKVEEIHQKQSALSYALKNNYEGVKKLKALADDLNALVKERGEEYHVNDYLQRIFKNGSLKRTVSKPLLSVDNN